MVNDVVKALQDHLDKQAQNRQLASASHKPSFNGGVKIGTGGRFLSGGPVKAPGPAPKVKSSGGGGGFFHALGQGLHDIKHGAESGLKWEQKKTDLAAHDIQAMPAGIWQGLSAGGHDVAKFTGQHLYKPLGIHQSSYVRNAEKTPWKVPALGKAMLHQTVQTFEHPLRDPFLTGLNVGMVAAPVAGVAARAGAASDAMAAAGDAGIAGKVAEGAKAFGKKPVMPHRIIQNPTLHEDAQGVIQESAYSRAIYRLAAPDFPPLTEGT